ncbi:hypothetical protein ACFL4U_01625 [Candidatus Neomarinimicrobiota bacterium]
MKVPYIIIVGTLLMCHLAGQSQNGCNNPVSEDSQLACEVVNEFIEAVIQGDSTRAANLRYIVPEGDWPWFLGFEDDQSVIFDLKPPLIIRPPWLMSEERVEDVLYEGYILTETGHHFPDLSYAKPGDMETIVSFRTDAGDEEILWFHFRKNDDGLWRIHSWQRYNKPYGFMVPLTIDID